MRDNLSKIYWLSEHDMSPSQQYAIRELHGVDVEIVKESPALLKSQSLEGYINSREDGFVYVLVDDLPEATCTSLRFGFFTNYNQKRREDGTEALAAVHHMKDGEPQKVWVNPEQTGDRYGMSLLGAFPGYK